MRLRSSSPLVVASGFIVAVACGSGDDASINGNNVNGDGGVSNSAFADGSTGNGDGSGNNNNGNCSAPVDMFIMFDRSGSMHDEGSQNGSDDGDCNLGQNVNSKWCKAINALSGYFNSQSAKGQAAALHFFPLETHDNDEDLYCSTGDTYNVATQPASGFTDLPTNAFDALLNNESPSAHGAGLGTPTEAAIRGLMRFTEANRRGGRVTIGILITDGDPNGCDLEGGSELSDLLQQHHAATQIRTYVIGMEGASFDRLERMSQGGNAPQHPDNLPGITNACGNGNGPCRSWNVGDGAPEAFIAALAAIQASADGCKDGGGFINPIK